MLRKLFYVITVALIFGCSSMNSRNVIGGYDHNMETGLSIYHQYQITTIITEKGKVIERKKFFYTDLEEALPFNTTSLQLGLLVINPYKQNFEVWSNTEIADLETDKVIFKQKRLRKISQLLPEELFSIDLPLESENSKVIFSVYFINESGKVLYSTNSAMYKIGSLNK